MSLDICITMEKKKQKIWCLQVFDVATLMYCALIYSNKLIDPFVSFHLNCDFDILCINLF